MFFKRMLKKYLNDDGCLIIFFHSLYPFRVTDDVFQQLEDNQVTLSTMKASRYVKAFEAEVRIMCDTTS